MANEKTIAECAVWEALGMLGRPVGVRGDEVEETTKRHIADNAKHPSGQVRFQRLGERFRQLQKEHLRASEAMWAGMLASSFTDEELTILSDFLCPNEVRLLQRIRQPVRHDSKPGLRLERGRDD